MDHKKDWLSDYRKKLILMFLLVSSILPVAEISGQKTNKEAPPFRERLFYGGSFGLQLGTYTDIQVSPVIGFWVLPRLDVAIGPDYRFYKDPSNRTDIYGGSAYTQFFVIQDFNSIIPLGIHMGLFLHLEDQLLSLQSSVWKSPLDSGRFFMNTVLAGAGISQQLGRRSSLNMMFLWAISNPPYDLYGTPEVRVSFIF